MARQATGGRSHLWAPARPYDVAGTARTAGGEEPRMSSHLARATVVTLCLATLLAGCSGGDRGTSAATSSARERRDPSTPAEPLQLSGTSWRRISMDARRDDDAPAGAEEPAVVASDGERDVVDVGVHGAEGRHR